jgi:LytS/YehU family sensor histidine kinase
MVDIAFILTMPVLHHTWYVGSARQCMLTSLLEGFLTGWPSLKFVRIQLWYDMLKR